MRCPECRYSIGHALTCSESGVDVEDMIAGMTEEIGGLEDRALTLEDENAELRAENARLEKIIVALRRR